MYIPVIIADGIIKQDWITNKFGSDIHGQTFDIGVNGLTMHKETNNCDSDSDHNANNTLNSDNDVEIISDEYLISEQ